MVFILLLLFLKILIVPVLKQKIYLYFMLDGSTPGINMIPYKVYKSVLKLYHSFLKFFSIHFKTNNCANTLEGCFWGLYSNDKTPNPESIDEFQPISILNVEEKLFFSLLSKWLEDHIVKKNNRSFCLSKRDACLK